MQTYEKHEVEEGNGVTRICYFDNSEKREWYIQEEVFQGIELQQGEDGKDKLVYKLRSQPNLLELFPKGGAIKRNGPFFEEITDKPTIEAIVKSFKKTT